MWGSYVSLYTSLNLRIVGLTVSVVVVLVAVVIYCVCAANQEQIGEFEQERLELNREISKLKEQNERLNNDLSIRSQTVDKLKNKVRLSLQVSRLPKSFRVCAEKICH